MKTTRFVGLALLIGIATSGCVVAETTPPPTPSQQACLMKGTIHGWTVPDRTHLVVTSNVNDKYSVTVMPPCTGLNFTETLAFETRGPSVCVQPGDTITFRQGGTPPQRCVITGIQRLAKD